MPRQIPNLEPEIIPKDPSVAFADAIEDNVKEALFTIDEMDASGFCHTPQRLLTIEDTSNDKASFARYMALKVVLGRYGLWEAFRDPHAHPTLAKFSWLDDEMFGEETILFVPQHKGTFRVKHELVPNNTAANERTTVFYGHRRN